MRILFTALIVCITSVSAVLAQSEVIFVPVKVDGPVHDPANSSYWFGPFSECASVLDVDGDGDLDLTAGRNWYEAPSWKKHGDFRAGAETNGPETDDNAEFAMDVNRDGRMDVVSSGWMRMKGAFWYANPGQTGTQWTATRFHSARSMEGVIHGDLDGDGDDDILCNHWSLVPGQGMTWLEHIDEAPWLVEHVIGTQGETHGNGIGDINGDGRNDIVTPVGWYEAPAKPREQEWPFHEDYKFQRLEHAEGGSGAASHPILIHDVNEDGLNDIIIGSAHNYGFAWLEQSVSDGGKRTFQQHWIETDFGQFHTMALGDLNGDGKADLVTGKRLFAHHGGDVSAFDPLFAFWYDIQGGKWVRHLLAYNHLPQYPDEDGHNPPPNFVVAVGMKVNIADMDADGKNDVVIAGKGGLYIFYNKGLPPKPRKEYPLPAHESYPSWIPWYTP